MKRRMISILAATILCVALTVSARAANRVTEITVDVTLDKDGSAIVVQTWNGRFDEGTECYFPVTGLEDITLSDLAVSSENGAYTTLGAWNVDASFADKAGKCGLNPVDGGFEVCWGIGRYGENRYTIEYRLDGLVGAYDDADGFLFQFVPDGMNTGPTDVTVRIYIRDGTALTEETAGVWAFGFDGQVDFAEDGGVLAHTGTPLTVDNNVILMLRLDKGILAPTRMASGAFEDVKARAFEGSDYGMEDGEEAGESENIYLILALLVAAGVGILIYFGGVEKRRVKKLSKSADYWREAPIGGNLEASFVLASRFHQSDDDGNLIAAALTRLLADGCLEPLTETDVGFMGREKKSVSLRLQHAPAKGGLTARLLYDLLTQAAGSDGVLQEKELEGYCKTNYSALLNVLAEAKRDGAETLTGVNCYKSQLDTETLAGLTGRGRQLLLQLIGYKKYLLDFSLIAERGLDEALIWRDCLTYAALLGIAGKVMEQLRSFYAGHVSAYARQMERNYFIVYRYHHATYGAARSGESAAKRTTGGGGHSSLGGGGGFLGGGHGGGTR